MENRFSNRDFEQFVKQNADQYRMYPSEQVWKNVHYTLHTRRKWYGFGLALLLLTTGAVTWLMIGTGKKEQIAANKFQIPSQQPTIVSKQKQEPKIYVASRGSSGKESSTPLISNAENLSNNIIITDALMEEDNNNDYQIAAVVSPVNETPVTALSQAPDLATKAPVVTVKRNAHDKPVLASKPSQTNISPLGFTENKVAPNSTVAENPIIKEDKRDIYPLTIESVVNSYQHRRSKKRLSWEVYFSPTISYRKLMENKAFINSALANNNALNYYTAISDINSLVTHKPDIGLQMGFAAGYPLTKNLKIKAGMQFNVSKYDIRAYTYNSEVATIALNTGGGANSVSTIANYRNFSGDNASWLRNLYISASLPVGLELKLNRGGKTDLGIAANVQPTYMLSNRVYLLSTDYKNYVEVPSLTRKWNFSGGLEIFAGLSTGKIQWKVGPHVRYQMLSSFDDKYPVKEHLFDFGLKVGVMLRK
ncbi:MAG: outer membrane beta-barrel protein [Chitinophagaceae bacterium]|nr:outer membrane beta-barrel protein [Chitinophagaceae bacterium]